MNRDQIDHVCELIDVQLQRLAEVKTDLRLNVPRWRDKTIKLLAPFVEAVHIEELRDVDGRDAWADKSAYQEALTQLRDGIIKYPHIYLAAAGAGRHAVLPARGKRARVFVVHGHDSVAKLEVARTLESLGAEAVILHEQINQGRTLIEKFEKNAAEVDFACVLLTPDDLGYAAGKPSDVRPRARQNVVLELGYFVRALGRDKVWVGCSGDIELPSDYLGVVYHQLDEREWKWNLARELRAAGFTVDFEKLV
jgi:predicted nucleotide-binding protein